ncbi:MAG: hypothetical protein LBP22_14490 [Deltaproteobacteria bacterium]|jgi:hypothetical protein|nr:hypothetical protein [Deltaproteobacteria bacterium]
MKEKSPHPPEMLTPAEPPPSAGVKTSNLPPLGPDFLVVCFRITVSEENRRPISWILKKTVCKSVLDRNIEKKGCHRVDFGICRDVSFAVTFYAKMTDLVIELNNQTIADSLAPVDREIVKYFYFHPEASCEAIAREFSLKRFYPEKLFRFLKEQTKSENRGQLFFRLFGRVLFWPPDDKLTRRVNNILYALTAGYCLADLPSYFSVNRSTVYRQVLAFRKKLRVNGENCSSVFQLIDAAMINSGHKITPADLELRFGASPTAGLNSAEPAGETT